MVLAEEAGLKMESFSGSAPSETSAASWWNIGGKSVVCILEHGFMVSHETARRFKI